MPRHLADRPEKMTKHLELPWTFFPKCCVLSASTARSSSISKSRRHGRFCQSADLGRARARDARSEKLIPFHFVMEGSAWLQTDVPGYASIALGKGDIVLLPRGDAHFIGSEPTGRVQANMARYRRPDDGELPFRVTDIGGTEGPAARIVCGYFGCDAGPFNPLIDALPPVTHIRPHPWQDCVAATFISAALNERNSSRPGGEAIFARLSELMLLHAIRIHIATLPEESDGWLSGLRDPQIGKVLQLIHSDPGRDWTLREPRRRRRHVALRPRRTLHPPGQASANAIPGPLAHAAGDARLDAAQHHHRRRRRRSGL